MNMRLHNRKSGFTLIELLVVLGIVVILISFAAVSFYGATKKEGYNKAKRLLADVLREARQQACVTGQPYAVMCFNETRDLKIAGETMKELIPSFALYRYLGRVTANGSNLSVPFNLETDLLSSIPTNTTVSIINLNQSSAKVYKIRRPKTNNNAQSGKIKIEGRNGSFTTEDSGYRVAEFVGAGGSGSDWENAPIAIQASQTYVFPKGYLYKGSSESFREMVVFNPDGTLRSKSVNISVQGGGDEFSLAVAANGEVSVKDSQSELDD